MPPTSRKEVRYFIDLVNYYLDMWEICSHTLSSLSQMKSSKVKFK